ncbi:long-chain acyl-CoA synthetase [Nocardia sp. GAS34]|uniref:acyl-CoA synthetase n=1 Tax=unclassified Nocardia TaxID=2637762 RepID=UPI003D1F1038
MYPGTHAGDQPDKPAVLLAGTDRVVTYRELDEGSLRLARMLFEAGLRRGDHVALLTDNDPTAFIAYWAALRSGLYITAINWHLGATEAAYIVNDCEARVLITAAALGGLAADIADATPQVRIRVSFGGEVPGHEPLEPILAQASCEPLPAQPRGADMLYSSGTTGRPKGIKPTLPDYEIDAQPEPTMFALGQLFGFGLDTIYLSPAPLYHAAPLRFCGWVQAWGGTVVLLPRFDPETALATIERYRITHSQWVPTMFVRMLKMPEQLRTKYDLSSHRRAIHAAAPCPVEVKRAMIDWWGPILVEYYASTEGSGLTFIDSQQWLERPGSVGRAMIGIVHICGDDGAELATGETGTVYYERDEPTFEYHNDPGKTRDGRHPRFPSWATVGDIGHVDADGYLFLTDRKAFMIISGGVNIYPQEIEDALALHPKVDDVAVVGVPDPEMGQSVRAFVQAAADAAPGSELAAELTGFLRERIAHFKVPREFEFVSELPRTPTGKLAKGKLLQRHT